MTNYLYAPQFRQPTTCTMPDGLAWDLVEAPQQGTWRDSLPVSSHYFGLVQTASPINAADCDRFGLKAVAA